MTRSVSRGVRLNNGSPVRRGLTPQRRRPRHRAPKGIAPSPRHSPRPPPSRAPPAAADISCAHTDDAACTCGNPVRPGTTDVESKNYSAPFLRNILGITAAEVDMVSGYSRCLKEAIIQVCQRPGTVAQKKGFHWRIVVDNVPVPWIADVATIMINSCSLRISDLAVLGSDDFPLGEPDDEADWTDVNEDIVDLRNGVFCLTTTAGRAFICYSFMPALMRLLQHGGQADLMLKLWSTAISGDHERCTNFYLYHLVKCGFGKFSAAKLSFWKGYVNDQRIYAMGLKQDQQALQLEAIKESVGGRSEGPGPEVLLVVENLARQLAENAMKFEAQEIINNKRFETYEANAVIYRSENERRFETELAGQEGEMNSLSEVTKRLEAQDKINAERFETYEKRFETRDAEVAIHKGEMNALTEVTKKLEAQEIINTKRFETYEANEVIYRSENEKRFETHDAEIASQKAEMNSVNEEQHRQANLLQNITEMRGEMREMFQEIRGKSGPAPPKGIPRAYIYFRIRDCASNVEDTIPDHEIYHQIFTSNESNRIVSRAVVNTGFTKPFLIALMGYSGAGKTFTAFGADGVFATILKRLPNVSVTVMQILENTEVLGTFEDALENIHQIIDAITAARSTAVTPANQLSSRTHLAIIFKDQENNVPYGMMIDVAGCEKTENMSQLPKCMARDSRDIGQDNMYLRKLLEELATKGHKGFVSREVVSTYKAITKLNREVAKFMLHLRDTPAVRVVLCAHHDPEVILKTSWREIEMWEEKEEAG